MSPYRTDLHTLCTCRRTACLCRIGPRWGATFWGRLMSIFARVEREKARADRNYRRAYVLRCWEQMWQSAGLLYTIRCCCGHHKPIAVLSSVPGQMAESWPYVNPRDVEP